MLVKLISTNSYNSYNIELAHILGLHEAIYLNELININEKAIRKNKIENNFFRIDRKYICERTTIEPDEQRYIDTELEFCSIIEVKDRDKISINLSRLTAMLMDGNESSLKGFAKEIRSKKKETKADIIRSALKKNIKTDNEELYNAYCEWIDSVSNKRGYMDKKAVVAGQSVIDNFCNRDLDKALKIISIATVNSYINMDWAVNVYKKDNKVFSDMPTLQNVNQLSSEVF